MYESRRNPRLLLLVIPATETVFIKLPHSFIEDQTVFIKLSALIINRFIKRRRCFIKKQIFFIKLLTCLPPQKRLRPVSWIFLRAAENLHVSIHIILIYAFFNSFFSIPLSPSHPFAQLRLLPLISLRPAQPTALRMHYADSFASLPIRLFISGAESRSFAPYNR